MCAAREAVHHTCSPIYPAYSWDYPAYSWRGPQKHKRPTTPSRPGRTGLLRWAGPQKVQPPTKNKRATSTAEGRGLPGLPGGPPTSGPQWARWARWARWSPHKYSSRVGPLVSSRLHHRSIRACWLHFRGVFGNLGFGWYLKRPLTVRYV